jgi:uncharacterized protein YbbC (DUF1343 family)
MRLGLLSLTFLFFFCQRPAGNEVNGQDNIEKAPNKEIIPGAWNLNSYLPMLEGKNVALAVNQTSMVEDTHLVDTLISRGINVVKVFAPEHGFRDMADAGEAIENSIDPSTGIPIVSLYGSNKKPSAQQLQDVDVIIFDIQDVGVRFYTYITTMHYLMEAAADHNKKIIVMDRPNPHGMHVAGPVLQEGYESFVGIHPIPVVHGLTVGELAKMINGEDWIEGEADLTVIEMDNYDHSKRYSLPVKPSPNLPNDLSISLYPSLCFFEGTVISVGRGTDAPFQQIGHPDLKGKYSYSFTPKSVEGAKNPPHKGKEVYGINFQDEEPEYDFTLKYLLEMYNAFPQKDKFFNNFFERLIGNGKVREQIKAGMTEEEITATWQEDLDKYKEIRKKYLIYPDFE